MDEGSVTYTVKELVKGLEKKIDKFIKENRNAHDEMFSRLNDIEKRKANIAYVNSAFGILFALLSGLAAWVFWK